MATSRILNVVLLSLLALVVCVSISYSQPVGFHITLHNPTTIATINGMQQNIEFDPSNALYNGLGSPNLGNIRFNYTGVNLTSWCENGCSSTATNSLFWVKLPFSIPGSSSIVINMTFYANTVNYNAINAGEAPEQSNTYAAFDNGNIIFNLYYNYSGNVIPPGTNLFGAAFISNGLFTPPAGGVPGSGWFGNSLFGLNRYVLDIYGGSTNGISTLHDNYFLAGYQTSTSQPVRGIGWTETGCNALCPVDAFSPSGISEGTIVLSNTILYVMSTNWNVTSNSIFYDNYGSRETLTGSEASQQPIGIGGGATTSWNGIYYWTRLRINPPQDVMPTNSITPSTSTTTTSTSTTSTSTSTTTSSTSTTSTSTSTSSTTVPFTTIPINNTGNVSLLTSSTNSIGGALLSGFNIVPYFAYILMFLGFGLAYIRSHKISNGMLIATLLAYVIFAIETAFGVPVSFVNIGIVVIVTTITGLIIVFESAHKTS